MGIDGMIEKGIRNVGMWDLGLRDKLIDYQSMKIICSAHRRPFCLNAPKKTSFRYHSSPRLLTRFEVCIRRDSRVGANELLGAVTVTTGSGWQVSVVDTHLLSDPRQAFGKDYYSYLTYRRRR